MTQLTPGAHKAITTPPVRSSTAAPEAGERLGKRQRSLIDRYQHEPEAALVSDGARTYAENDVSDGPLDPLHTWVEVGRGHQVCLPVAVHHAVGGLSDLPVPGDILCAALAACLDSSIRVVGNALRVGLQSLSVQVSGHVDVRGALCVSPEVPVGFQRFEAKVMVRAVPGTQAGRLERALVAAERSCVVFQTLRGSVPIDVTYDTGAAPEGSQA